MRKSLLHVLALLCLSFNFSFADCGSVPNNLAGLVYMGEYDGSKYYCSEDNYNNWNEATATTAATQLGGHLAVINSAGENNFIKNGIMSDAIWIGLADEMVEGNFMWINGEQVSYTNWAYGEPNNQGFSGYNADYAVLIKSSGQWKDRNGTDDYEFVIEVPCAASQPACDSEITGLTFHDINGNNDIQLVDGGTYELNQLPSNFNIEALIAGNAESVRFYMSGAHVQNHTENVTPYRFVGDNNALSLGLGNYTLKVKAFSEDHASGTVCDEITVQFTIGNTSVTCDDVVCTREVESTTSCNGNGPYTIWLANGQGGNMFDGAGETWEECADGTIHYYGTAHKTVGTTDDEYVEFDLYFSNKTSVAPANSPKEIACGSMDESTFFYYTSTTGTITTPNHGVLNVIQTGPVFQLGIGANQQQGGFGASGWMVFYGGDDYYSNGDVNVMLSQSCEVTPTCTGSIDGIALTNGTESITLQDGETYKVCDLPTNNYLEAVVSGGHESFKFTVNGENRTENAEPYNYPSVSNGETWSPGPGTYTIKGYLFSENQLGGTLCDEVSIEIEVVECTPTCTGSIDGIALTNGTESITLQDGETYKVCDLPADNYLEAVVSGGHESFKFTVNGENRTENAEPYNYPSASNGETWNPGPGTYTIKGHLFSDNQLGGMLCDEVSIEITVEECQIDPCADNNFDIDCEKNINGAGWSLESDCDVRTCEGDKIMLSVNPDGYPTSWTGPNGFTANTNDILVSENATVSDAGNYVATVDVNGCIKTKTIKLRVYESPVASVATADLTCGATDGAIEITFPDNPGRTGISFSIDGGLTYKSVADNSGSTSFDNLEAGTYEVVTRWGNTECPADLGVFTLEAPSDDDQDGVCNSDDCRPNDAFYPATPGTPCDDMDVDTENDMVQADGCSCAGEIIDPCVANDFDIVCEQNLNDEGWKNDGDCKIRSCEGDKVMLSVAPNGYPTTWTGPNGFTANTNDILISENATAANAGNYTATVDVNGCIKSQTIRLYVFVKPEVDVETSDLTCGEENGIIKLLFNDTPGRSHIKFSIDGGVTYPIKVKDNTGSASFENLEAGTYDVYVRWGNSDCPKDLGVVTLEAPVDSDEDGLCDNDDCRPNDAFYPAVAGTPCDDNDPMTLNDMVTADGCGCEGTFDACALLGGDSDEDGTCDSLDCRPNDAFYPAVAGTPCDDNDPMTLNDMVTADGCGCAGTFDACALLGGDSDEDGTCDSLDCRPNDAFYPAVAGTPCDDNDPMTLNDMVTADGCGCAGTFDACALLGGDSDEDGTCDSLDCRPNDAFYPAVAGTPCDDNDPMTLNDMVTADGCGCEGTFDACALLGGDSDEDGTCDSLDCRPNDAFYPAMPGTPCDDMDPMTVNDVVTADGCGCEGTFDACALLGGDSDEDGTCDSLDCRPNDAFYPAVAGTPCDDMDPMTLNDMVTADGCGCEGTFDACALLGGDSDEDGTCDSLDCRPNDAFYPAMPGTPCDDGNPNTELDVVLDDGCSCAGVQVTVCNNVEIGGLIGFEGCEGAYSYCPVTNPIVPTIQNCESPVGGTGDLEVVWLKSTTSCLPPTTTFENIANDPHWSVIEGATDLTLDPMDITQNTCFLRCVKRAGCDEYIESNIISLTINVSCLRFDRFGVSIGDRVWDDLNGDGVQDADEPGIPYVYVNLQDGNGNSILWTNTDENGDYIFFGLTADEYQLQFSTPAGYEITIGNGDDEFEADDDATDDSDINPNTGLTPVFELSEGDHVRNLDAGYRTAGMFLAANGTDFQFEAVKQEEHTELYWSHNASEEVADYIIERAANGADFEEITLQSSKGGSDMELYNDYDLAPVTGDNLYRVKLIRTDGTVSYSAPILVHFADLVDFSVFPNPASDFVKINLESLVGQQVEIKIISGLGAVIETVSIGQVYSKYHQIDLRDLKEGMYSIWVQPANHKAVTTQLMIAKP